MATGRRTGRPGGAESLVAGEEEVGKGMGHDDAAGGREGGSASRLGRPRWRPALSSRYPSREAHRTGPPWIGWEAERKNGRHQSGGGVGHRVELCVTSGRG
jgi:hypothetical protein